MLLAAGISLGLSPTPRHYFRVLKNIPKEWRKFDKPHLYRLSRSLKEKKFIDYRRGSDNTQQLFLTEKGKAHLKRLDFYELKLSNFRRWDKKWRMILFDIPETRKRSRDALRRKLKELGCCELQKSVFIWPYDCRKEIEFIVDFFKLKSQVVYAEAVIQNDFNLRRFFKL